VLPVLYCSEYNHTLDEKLGYCIAVKRDPYLVERYKDMNQELTYGLEPQFLMARKVKNLRCGENKGDNFEATLYWTELPKYVPSDPNNPDAGLKLIRSEQDRQYTWSISPALEAKRKRRASAT